MVVALAVITENLLGYAALSRMVFLGTLPTSRVRSTSFITLAEKPASISLSGVKDYTLAD